MISPRMLTLFIINLLADPSSCGDIGRVRENGNCREVCSRAARTHQICR